MKMDISKRQSLLVPKLLFVLLCCLNISSLADDCGDGIQDDPFVQCLKANIIPKKDIPYIIFTPTNPNYTHTLQDYIRNSRFANVSNPTTIVTPLNIPQIQATVLCAQKTGTHLKIRSGGHDYEGLSYTSADPFAIIDMFNLRSIDINVDAETAWVQSGATLGEFYYNIWQKSKVHAFPGGVCPTIGVGGHVSGGGYSNMIRKFGLTIDNMIDATLVDAKGRILDREGMGEDVFWALRGGGGASFGVIVAYKLKIVRVPPVVTVFKISKTLEQNAAEILFRWQNMAYKADRNLFVRAFVYPSLTNNNKKTATAMFIAMYLGSANQLVSIMRSTFSILGVKGSDCQEMRWVDSLFSWAFIPDGTPETALLSRVTSDPRPFKMKSDYVKTAISKNNLQGVLRKLAQTNISMMFNPYGGRINEIPPTDTPFPHRDPMYLIQYLLYWTETGPDVVERKKAESRDFYKFMTPWVSKNPREAFQNYRDLDIGSNDNGPDRMNEARVYGEKYFRVNFNRLVRAKTQIDPTDLFRHEQSIPPQK